MKTKRDGNLLYCVLYISWPSLKGRKAFSFSLEMLVVANYTDDMHLKILKYKANDQYKLVLNSFSDSIPVCMFPQG